MTVFQELAHVLAERLVRRACQRLPRELREECYREWVAELPMILDDPDVCFMWRRVLKALFFAADQSRGIRGLGARMSRPTVSGSAEHAGIREQLEKVRMRCETVNASDLLATIPGLGDFSLEDIEQAGFELRLVKK